MKNGILIYCIWIFLCLAGIVTMVTLLTSIAQVTTISIENIILYGVVALLSSLYIFLQNKYWGGFKNSYIAAVVMFVIYMLMQYYIVNIIFGDAVSVLNGISGTDLLAKYIWLVPAFGSFLIGYRNVSNNKTFAVLALIIMLVFCLISFVIYNRYSAVHRLEYNYAKDAYFIALAYLPILFLIKSPKLKIIFMILFFAIGAFSLKRSIVLVIIVAYALYFLLYDKISFVKKILISCLCVGLYFLISSVIGLDNDVFMRFANIGEDGGSGRTNIYANVLMDFQTFSSREMLLGRGINSVIKEFGINAHMDILEVLHSCGIVGLAFYLCIYLSMFHTIWKYKYICGNDDIFKTSIIAFVVFAIVSNLNCIMFNPVFTITYLFILSYLMGICRGKIETYR